MSRRRFPSAHGLFITGTDTGVGKTLVAAGLAAWCRAHGIDVGVMKPVATGGLRLGNRWVSPDAKLLAAAAGADDSLELVNPVCYRDPLAPYAASLRSLQPVDWPAMRRAFEAMMARHQFLIVEGIGGLLVPLSRRRTVLDLIHVFRLPCLIVSRLRLGTLNHTLLTVRQAEHEGVSVVGVVLNAEEPPTADADARLAERTNPSVLRACLPVPLLGVLPYRREFANGSSAPMRLSRWVARALDPAFLRWLQGQGGRAGQPARLPRRRV